MMEQADCVMCQQRKLSKGHEEAKPDKQADQVLKKKTWQYVVFWYIRYINRFLKI